MIYLDNASTTQVSEEVLNEMMPFLKEQYGNPGTIYGLGRKSADAIKLARERVAEFINSAPEQIIFTSGGSEANSIVFGGICEYLNRINKHHIIVSSVEHDSVMKSVKKMHGFDVSFLPVRSDGCVSVDELEDMITEDTGLVSVMYVNNETGSVNQVKAIGRVCNKRRILFHTDCVQAAGCYPIDVKDIGCDFASISSHKIHGAKGTGALFVQNLDFISSIINGGAHQEFGRRGGTENVPGIVGLGVACQIAYNNFDYIRNATDKRRVEFLHRFNRNIEKYGIGESITINGDKSVGKTLNITVKNVDGETLVLAADANGVCISAGSACRSHESEPSHVLLAMGLSPDDARDSIRVSFSDYNTEEEVVVAADIISSCIYSLLNM